MKGASRVRSCYHSTCYDSKSEQLLASVAHIDINCLGLHDDMRPVCIMNNRQGRSDACLARALIKLHTWATAGATEFYRGCTFNSDSTNVSLSETAHCFQFAWLILAL